MIVVSSGLHAHSLCVNSIFLSRFVWFHPVYHTALTPHLPLLHERTSTHTHTHTPLLELGCASRFRVRRCVACISVVSVQNQQQHRPNIAKLPNNTHTQKHNSAVRSHRIGTADPVFAPSHTHARTRVHTSIHVRKSNTFPRWHGVKLHARTPPSPCLHRLMLIAIIESFAFIINARSRRTPCRHYCCWL